VAEVYNVEIIGKTCWKQKKNFSITSDKHISWIHHFFNDVQLTDRLLAEKSLQVTKVHGTALT